MLHLAGVCVRPSGLLWARKEVLTMTCTSEIASTGLCGSEPQDWDWDRERRLDSAAVAATEPAPILNPICPLPCAPRPPPLKTNMGCWAIN